jgi:aminoglycoside 6'-N-acetyltransferase I
MLIRHATQSDLAEWLRMRSRLWPDCPIEDHQSEMQEQLNDPAHNAVFVVERNADQLGGFLEASLRPFVEDCHTSPVGYLEGWYVDVDLRQQGLGGELVKAAEQWASVQGCHEMASDCELDNNVSLKAHLALGYAETGRLIHFRKFLKA